MQTRDVLRLLMRSKQISEWRLAEETAVSQSTINAILTGRSREQKDSTLEPLAAYFECTLAQLRGYEPLEGLGTAGRNQYPVIEARAINGWIAEEYARDYFTEFVRSAHTRGLRCFVFVANDDAMSPLIPKGRKVFVDPDAQPDGSGGPARIALIESGGYYGLREEVSDLGETAYKPLEAGFRTLSAGDCVRIGYVVGLPEENWI